ncbi:MAG: hypothetical protein ACR2OY_01145 [Boseongicola sp.]
MFLFLDPIRMIQDIRSQGGFIGTWGGLLNIPQLIGGLFFVFYIEGLVILLTVILTLMIAGQIHKRAPFSRLIGICHLPWLALLPWLIWRLSAIVHPTLLFAWLIYVAVTIAVSLVFDIFDIYRFFRGDKKFAWAE